MIRFWNKLPVVITSPIIGLVVSTFGTTVWATVATSISAPASFLITIVFLWLYWQYLGGSWPPQSTKTTRLTMCRIQRMPGRVWLVSMAAALLIVLIEQAGLVVTFRIIHFPAEMFLSAYSFLDKVPIWAAWGYVVMISLVAAVCEEIGFRGYMQVPLEERYGQVVAIAVVSVIFVLAHLHQAWAGPVVVHIFAIGVLFGTIAYYSKSLIPGIVAHFIMDLCNFAFWWSKLGYQFARETVSETGMDLHLVIWSVVLIVALAGYVGTIRRLRQYS